MTKSSTELKQKAAGYMLASSNASKREMNVNNLQLLLPLPLLQLKQLIKKNNTYVFKCTK